MKKRSALLFTYAILLCYLCRSTEAAPTETPIAGASAKSSIDDIPAETSIDGDDEIEDADRTKRQHDNGGGNPLKSLFGSVLNKKLGVIGSLSSLSSSSKGSGHGTAYEPPPPPPPPKPFDWWSFKKSIVASLLQAVKAITGGVIAFNGQLVKVKGHLLAVKGNLINTKGDTITNFGKHLATNAFGPPHHGTTHDDSHSASPSGPSADTDYALNGPSNAHGLLDSAYPHNEFRSAIAYPNHYYKEHSPYSKREAPSPHFVIVNDDNNRLNTA